MWKLYLLRNWKQPENGAFQSLIMMIGHLCSDSCFDNVMRGNGDKRSNQSTSWPTQPSPSIWHFIKTTNTARLFWDFERVDCLRFLSVKSCTCLVPFCHPRYLIGRYWIGLLAQCTSTQREVVKNGYFTVRLTVRGGGSVPSALTVSKCAKFGPIFPIIKW